MKLEDDSNVNEDASYPEKVDDNDEGDDDALGDVPTAG